MPLFEKVDTPLKKRVPAKKHSPVVEITHASRTLFINKTTTSTVKQNFNSELIGSVTGGIAMAFPWHFSMEMRQETVPIMVVMFTINFVFTVMHQCGCFKRVRECPQIAFFVLEPNSQTAV